MRSAYILKYGWKEGARRMRAHGYDCLDYQEFVNTETDFFRLSEKEFEKAVLTHRRILEGEGLQVYQAHGPWRSPPRDLDPQDRAERFAVGTKGISYVRGLS